jgi:type IX secretion system PorP/SprF family membrane protein
MKITKIKAAIIGVLALVANSAFAQIDPHFSQYYANPLWLNPALTGVTDGSFRANINAKQQWSNLNDGYLTVGASFDAAPTKNFAFGGIIINQRAGAVAYNQLSALASASYRIRFGQAGDKIINFGLQAGIINKSIDLSRVTLGSQYNPNVGYDGAMPFDEAFAAENFTAPDANAGVMFFDAADYKMVNVFVGGSVAHLNRPRDRFVGGNSKLPMRFAAHGGARIKINNMFGITPNALYLSQGSANQFAVGAYAQMMLNNETDVLFGSNYRVDDAAIAFLGFHIKSMVFGVSYDFNTSDLNRATGSKGGLELSISFTGKKGIVGPNFFCPRL